MKIRPSGRIFLYPYIIRGIIYCQRKNMKKNQKKISVKKQSVFLWLALLLGQVGAHNFYVGNIGSGIGKIVLSVLNIYALIVGRGLWHTHIILSHVLMFIFSVPLMLWILWDMYSTSRDKNNKYLISAPRTKIVVLIIYVIGIVGAICQLWTGIAGF